MDSNTVTLWSVTLEEAYVQEVGCLRFQESTIVMSHYVSYVVWLILKGLVDVVF